MIRDPHEQHAKRLAREADAARPKVVKVDVTRAPFLRAFIEDVEERALGDTVWGLAEWLDREGGNPGDR